MLVVVAALVVLAAIVDLRTREIPDTISILLVLSALVARFAGWHDVSWSSMAIGAVVGCLVPTLLALLGAMGGGDVKLLGAIGFVVGWEGLLRVLYWTALAGGLLAVAVLVLRRFRRADEQGDDEDAELAYGPAIAAGFLVSWAVGDLLVDPGAVS